MLVKHDNARKKSHGQKVVKTKLTEELVHIFMQKVKAQFDSVNGGFYKRPKFPEASKLTLLLDIYALYGDKEALHMAEFTLKKNGRGWYL